jgi:hypothetical protein
MMTRLDDKVKAALDADDEAFLRELDADRGLFTQVGDTMKGPLGGWAAMAFFMALLLAAFLLFAVWRMFTVEAMQDLVRWTAGAVTAMVALGFVKQWFFERMNFIALLRELKRIELRIAQIEGRRAD